MALCLSKHPFSKALLLQRRLSSQHTDARVFVDLLHMGTCDDGFALTLNHDARLCPKERADLIGRRSFTLDEVCLMRPASFV